jgi:hypothetical protein
VIESEPVADLGLDPVVDDAVNGSDRLADESAHQKVLCGGTDGDLAVLVHVIGVVWLIERQLERGVGGGVKANRTEIAHV